MEGQTPSKDDLRRGQRALDRLIGSKIIDARAVQGGVAFDITHRGTDDEACILTVPLAGISFWDDPDTEVA